MEGSILTHITGNFIPQYENVANSSVCYLLNRYSASRTALKRLLSLKEVPINYMAERSTKSHGRPDITGLDSNGNKVLIIEGKFWANLTDNQPANYLKELSPEGKLLFLAPDRRIPSLQTEIQKRLDRVENRIHISSWLVFLNLVESENSKEYNSNLASDLVQLRDLCVKMDDEGMPPLSMTDLDPMNGRLTYQLADLIDECNRILRKWEPSNFTGLKSGGLKYGYGFYFRAFTFSCWLGFSSYDWYRKKSHSPIWLHIYTHGFKGSDKIYNALNNYDPDNSYREDTKSLFAIILQPGMDRNQVIEFIVEQVKSVLTALSQDASL